MRHRFRQLNECRLLLTAALVGILQLAGSVVATSAAAVVVPVAGEIDRCLRTRLTPTVRVRELDLPTPQKASP